MRFEVTVEFRKSTVAEEGYTTRINDGDTIRDLAEQEDINLRKCDVLVNGSPEGLDYELVAGDHVTVVTRNYNSGAAA